MNRKIKFRIWADNQFYYKCLVGNTNDTDDKKYTCPVVWLDDMKEWVNCDNGIISQYVGLKDKNGVEIYEGDIVRIVYDSIEHIYQIIFDKEELDFKATNGEINYGGNFQYLGCCEEIEVIGNIYENEAD